MNEVYIKRDSLNKWIVKHLPTNQDLYTIDDLINAIEEMDSEIENLKDKIEDLEQDIEDNYKPISKGEMYDVGDDDFI